MYGSQLKAICSCLNFDVGELWLVSETKSEIQTPKIVQCYISPSFLDHMPSQKINILSSAIKLNISHHICLTICHGGQIAWVTNDVKLNTNKINIEFGTVVGIPLYLIGEDFYIVLAFSSQNVHLTPDKLQILYTLPQAVKSNEHLISGSMDAVHSDKNQQSSAGYSNYFKNFELFKPIGVLHECLDFNKWSQQAVPEQAESISNSSQDHLSDRITTETCHTTLLRNQSQYANLALSILKVTAFSAAELWTQLNFTELKSDLSFYRDHTMASWLKSSRRIHMALGVDVAGRAWASGRLVWDSGFHLHAPSDHIYPRTALAAAADIRTAVALPIGPAVLLVLYSRRQLSFDSKFQLLVSRLCTVITALPATATALPPPQSNILSSSQVPPISAFRSTPPLQYDHKRIKQPAQRSTLDALLPPGTAAQIGTVELLELDTYVQAIEVLSQQPVRDSEGETQRTRQIETLLGRVRDIVGRPTTEKGPVAGDAAVVKDTEPDSKNLCLPTQSGRKEGRFRRCYFEGCQKCSQGNTNYCVSHGGGKRCSVVGCEKGARDRFFCTAHGGGKRCSETGCARAAVGGSSFCTSHGGGKRCVVEGCTRASQSGGTNCVRHGGGLRCGWEGCIKVSRGKSGLCAAHGKMAGENQIPVTHSIAKTQESNNAVFDDIDFFDLNFEEDFTNKPQPRDGTSLVKRNRELLYYEDQQFASEQNKVSPPAKQLSWLWQD